MADTMEEPAPVVQQLAVPFIHSCVNRCSSARAAEATIHHIDFAFLRLVLQRSWSVANGQADEGGPINVEQKQSYTSEKWAAGLVGVEKK